MNVLEKMTKPFQRQPEAEEPISGPPEAANDDPVAKARRRRIVLLAGAVTLAVAVGLYIMSHVIGAEENRSPPVDQTQVVSVVPLALLGAVGARLGGAPAGRAALRVTVGGALAMGLTALIGQLMGATGL